MEFTILKGATFHVHELATDSAGAKIIAGKTVELRIFEIIDGGTWKLYDWNDDTFKDAGVVDDEDTCSHKQAGGVYNTGIWENDAAIDYTAFTVGRLYIFEFWNATDGEFVATPSAVQWGGQYGDIAKQTTVATDLAVGTVLTAIGDLNNLSSAQAQTAAAAAITAAALATAAVLAAVKTKTDNLPASPAAVGSKMDLDEDVAKTSGKVAARLAGDIAASASGTDRTLSCKKVGVPGAEALNVTIDEDGNRTVN